jgi:DNA-3-methyladenine glycosylase II
VSIHAAAAIWSRLEAIAEPFEAETFRALSDEDLRAAGLSRQKISYGRSLADLVATGEVKLHRLPRMADEEAVAELTKIKGIGQWTAEIYLLFALGRPDVWPVDDLALMVGAQHIKGLPERPDRKAMLDLGEDWRPWRGAVAHLLWHTYHVAELHRNKPGG